MISALLPIPQTMLLKERHSALMELLPDHPTLTHATTCAPLALTTQLWEGEAEQGVKDGRSEATTVYYCSTITGRSAATTTCCLSRAAALTDQILTRAKAASYLMLFYKIC